MSKYLTAKIIIDLANVDGLHPYELSFLKKFIKKNFKDTEQRELLSEITNPKESYLSNFKKIDDHFERDKVLSIARVILHIDNNFSPAEKEAYLILRDYHNEQSSHLTQAQVNAAKGLAQAVEELEYLKDFEEAAKAITQNVRYIPFAGFTILPDLSVFLKHRRKNKYLGYIVLVFIILSFILNTLFRVL